MSCGCLVCRIPEKNVRFLIFRMLPRTWYRMFQDAHTSTRWKTFNFSIHIAIRDGCGANFLSWASVAPNKEMVLTSIYANNFAALRWFTKNYGGFDERYYWMAIECKRQNMKDHLVSKFGVKVWGKHLHKFTFDVVEEKWYCVPKWLVPFEHDFYLVPVGRQWFSLNK